MAAYFWAFYWQTNVWFSVLERVYIIATFVYRFCLYEMFLIIMQGPIIS